MSGIIKGNTHTDARGTVRFVNEFDMTNVVRMYAIEPELGVIRAWQGHHIETKWFFAAKGSFLVKMINIENPALITAVILSDQESQILHIPAGHYNGFEALEKGSVLMVYSDANLKNSVADDHRKTLNDIPW